MAGNFKTAYWVRGGVVIRNTSRTARGGHQYYTINTAGNNKRWLNLTIGNIDM